MIIGRLLADANGWKVGDRVPIRSQIWRKLDGSDTWQFNIVAIYDVDGGGVNKASAFFQYDYFNESLQFGKDMTGMIAVRVDDSKQADAIAARIDAQFENSPSETKTATERAVRQAPARAGRRHRIDPGLGDGCGVLHHAAGDREHHGAVGARAHQ